MRTSLLAALGLAILSTLLGGSALAQSVEVKEDNGQPRGSYNLTSWEESVILAPDGPCMVDAIKVYYNGARAGRDTLWLVGDPAEGFLPPTQWVWAYNTILNVVVGYDGVPGWKTIDLSSVGLHLDGYDRLVVQHRVPANGPYFTIDNDSVSYPWTSFLLDPTQNNSLGFPGVYSLTQGDFMVRMVVRYDFPDGSTSQPPPAPSLVDVTRSVGLADGSGNYLKSARVSVADWNGDGWDDVAVGSAFYRNKGDGTFENVSSTIGIAAAASVWGDYDNDGRLDVYAVNGGAGDKLYRNNGDGTFTDVTAASGITNPRPTVSPIWLDYDHDGRLDLFISNGRTEASGNETYFPDQLFKNNGDGTFTNVTGSSGIAAGEPAPFLDCWGASACDYNNDGWTDIFVATYRLAPDLLYRNNGDGTFTEVAASAGVRGVPTSNPQYFGHGIGSEWGDYDNDGDVDLAVGNLGHPDWRGAVSNPSLIFRNSGAPGYTFTELHQELRLKFFEMNAGVVWLDLDLDGYLDLWHCQYSYQAAGENGEPRRLSRIYRNPGPDNQFHLRDATWSLGPIIHGAWTAARLDHDNDGDMDLVVASPTDALKLFRNDVPKLGNWLGVRLTGSPEHNVPKDAYGTRVVAYAGGKTIRRDLQGGGGGTTATQNSSELSFGLGTATTIDSLVVTFPNGGVKTLTNLAVNQHMTIGYEGASGVDATTGDGVRAGWSLTETTWRDGAVIFRLDAATPRYLRAELVDVSGRVVLSRTITDAHGTQRLSIGERLPAGVYLLRVTSGGETAVGRVAVP